MQAPNIFFKMEKTRIKTSGDPRRKLSIRGDMSHGEVARRHPTTSPLALSFQEQPVKSSSAAVVMAPAVTFSGMAVASLLVV